MECVERSAVSGFFGMLPLSKEVTDSYFETGERRTSRRIPARSWEREVGVRMSARDGRVAKDFTNCTR